MRFCPKCSLKIKANIEQCPICKVELLSCAEDDDVSAPLTEKRAHNQTASEKSPAPSPRMAPPAHEPATPAALRPDTAQDQVHPGEDLTLLTRKLKSLEDHLVHIEKTIEINSSKDDIIRSSIVDLESKINKQEKTLATLEAFPLDRLDTLEAEIARLSANSTSLHLDVDPQKNIGTPPVRQPSMLAPSEESIPPRDFSSQNPGFTGGAISFPETTEDDFEEPFEPILAERRSSREGKKKLPIVLPLIALLLIAVWLVFYYAKPRGGVDMQERVVAEKIVLPPLPKTADVQTEKNVPAAPADREISEKPTGSPLTPSLPEKQPPRTSQKPPAPAQAPLITSGYTVNVGSFKDKALALTLTTELREKGYSALMSPSKNKQFYRVKVGAFSTQKEAQEYATVIEKKEKLPTFVTQIN